MKYQIKLTTYATDKSAAAVISAALGFDKELSHGTLVDVFAKDLPHKNGVFTSKKRAQLVAERINQRGAFGGFPIATIAQAVAA